MAGRALEILESGKFVEDATNGNGGVYPKSTIRAGLVVNGESVSSSNPLDVTLSNSDIQIGAVEIKDATTDTRAIVNSSGQLHTVMRGHTCTDNSTQTPLGIGGVFTGTSEDTLDYATITIWVSTDQAGTLVVQYSDDESDWHDGETYTILADAEKFFTPTVQMRYFRIVYTNGGVEQTEFHLHTTLRKLPVKWSSHNITEPIVDEDDATLTKAVITGKKANGIYDNVSLTNGGNMKISIEEFESGVSSNSNSQLNVTPYHADGTEGILITGVKKETGKDGIDSSTNTLQIIEYEHHEIHSGSHYNIVGYQDLSINNVLQFTYVTPDTTKWAHFIWRITTESETMWEIYEAGTITTPLTTAITPINNNRNSGNTSGVTCRFEKHTSLAAANTSVSVAAATLLSSGISGAGKEGGEEKRSNELVLKQNTIYVFRATANAAGYINFDMEWYEHTDKN